MGICSRIHKIIKFSNLPSRFQSIFACRNLTEITYWKNLFYLQGFDNIKTFEIYSKDENCFIGDANWFNFKGLHESIKTPKFDNASWASYLYYSNQYWSGKFTSNPIIEVIVKLPCTINKLIID